MKTVKYSFVIALSFLITFLISCNDESAEEISKGQVSVDVTDAAAAFENISGVYLAVDEIQASANGSMHTIASFQSPKVFDLMSYQNGNTFNMGSGEIEAGTYSNLTFIMSATEESYILMKDGSKKMLTIDGNTHYNINGSFDVATNATTSIVADIDLRKALTYNDNATFTLRNTGRVVNKEETGTIKGKVEGQFDASSEVVVYAYKKGTYQASEESETASGTRFENSINSATVSETGEFTLSFMEKGEYEMVVVTYENIDNDNDLEFKSKMNADLSIGGSLLSLVTVESNSTITINLFVN